MFKHFFTAALLFCAAASSFAQHGNNEEPKKTQAKNVMPKPKGSYKIDVAIKNFAEKEVYLGYHFGSKQYILDTAQRAADGRYTFKRPYGLDPGIYLLILPPKNKYFELLIDKTTDMAFSIDTDTLDFVKNMKIKGNDDNIRFYDYLNFIGKQRQDAEAPRADFNSPDAKKKEAAKKALDAIDQKVKDYQANIIAKYPKSMNALVMRSTQETRTPEFKKPNGDTDTSQQFNFYKSHFFDNFDLADDRLIRTPILRAKVMRYLEQCIVHHPDSLAIGCDYVIEKTRANKETFKYWVTELLNEYAASKIVGMDAVYVALANKYYCSTPLQADWVEPDVLENICKDAKALEPLLIGKIAPDIKMYRQDNEIPADKLTDAQAVSLHGVKSPYTIVIFWDTECSHCQKSMPVVHDFYKKMAKQNGVEIFSVCTRIYDDYDKCWKMIKEKGWTDWMNVGDPYMRSRYKILYDIRSTPQMYLLDENKRIILKKIAAEQFEQEIPRCIENDKKMKEEAKKKAKK
jgi:thiol-disulfide isomerase/thioredoxin